MDKEFPILCDNCLGDNPYVRMVKEDNGAQCKLTQRPFTCYTWKAGNKKKSTIICRDIAVQKNICQCCLNDLQFSIPIGLRESFTGSFGTGASASSSSTTSNQLSLVNRAYQEEQLAVNGAEYDNEDGNIGGKYEPSYNLFVAAQKYGENGPYGHLKKAMDEKKKEAAEKGKGKAPTLYMSKLPEECDDADISAAFASIPLAGEIKKIHLLKPKRCAFIEFSEMDDAKKSLEVFKSQGPPLVRGHRTKIAFAEAKKN